MPGAKAILSFIVGQCIVNDRFLLRIFEMSQEHLREIDFLFYSILMCHFVPIMKVTERDQYHIFFPLPHLLPLCH